MFGERWWLRLSVVLGVDYWNGVGIKVILGLGKLGILKLFGMVIGSEVGFRVFSSFWLFFFGYD